MNVIEYAWQLMHVFDILVSCSAATSTTIEPIQVAHKQL